MAEWRFIAQRASTEEFLHWNLPLNLEEGPAWALSKTNSLSATIEPEYGEMVAPDGDLLLDEWGTFVYLLKKEDGDPDEIEWGGIVVHSKQAGATWRVELEGFSGYPHDMAYTGTYSHIDVDALDAYRHIWNHLQSQPNGDLGVVITGDTSSGVLLGEAELPAYNQYFIGGVWVNEADADPDDIDPRRVGVLYRKITSGATSLRLKSLAGFDTVTAFPYNIHVGGETMTVSSRSGTTLNISARGVGSSTVSGHYSGTGVVYDGTPVREVTKVDAEPYVLAYWENQDCGREIENLVETTPFEFRETHSWSGGVGSSIDHEIEVGYPTLGEQLDDLKFVMGENVTSVVEVDRDGDFYANSVIGVGKGEGATTIKASASVDDGRLRRVKLTTNKFLPRVSQMQRFVNRELDARNDIESIIETITVVEHPNAKIGAWKVGDEIYVQAKLPNIGEVAMWCRIYGWKLDTPTQATLQLARTLSSPQDKMARILAELERRLEPLERTTQIKYASVTTPGSETFPGSGVYNPPDIKKFKADPLADFTSDFEGGGSGLTALKDGMGAAIEGSDNAYDLAQEAYDLASLGGGGGGSVTFVYETSPGVWPARPAATTVVWVGMPGGIGPTPPAGEGELEGEGGALAGDIWLEVFE